MNINEEEQECTPDTCFTCHLLQQVSKVYMPILKSFIDDTETIEESQKELLISHKKLESKYKDLLFKHEALATHLSILESKF